MRKEFKFGIGGLIFGFVFCFCLFILVVSVSAAEPVEIQELYEPEIVDYEQAETGQSIGQDEQTEMSELPLMESDHGNVVADQPPQESEIAVAVVQDEQIDLTTMIPADQLEMLDNWAQELASSENEPQIEPFASGVIVGELADLLQENVIENDGYTDESWQRYEAAVVAGWDAISNFMIYTNDEVRSVIDELQASIAALEYPAGKLPETGNGSSADNGLLSGLLAVIVFSSGLRAAT